MLLMLGWRGEPGKKDEPQHVHQGRVMTKMLEDMDLPFVVLSEDMVEAEVQTKAAAQTSARHQRSCRACCEKKYL